MKRRFKVVFNREKCKGCELCINFCPKGILALDPEVNAKGYHPNLLVVWICLLA